MLQRAPEGRTPSPLQVNRLEANDVDPGATTQIIALDVTPPVLLVDDDPLVLTQLALLIQNAGFEVHTVESAQDALIYLKRDFRQIVITDLRMPGMDGLELCRTLRSGQWPGYIYVLLLTAQDGEDDILAGLNAGADDYLSKRASGAQLLARLRTAQRILTLEQSLKKALADKNQLAMTDSLTGAHNRRSFMRRLAAELKRAQRLGSDLSLLLVDIDYFKAVNDRMGHSAGDAVLEELVARIRSVFPGESQWCARLGGEEFAIVLGGEPLDRAAALAEKLRLSVASNPFQTPAGNVAVTISIGVGALQTLAQAPPVTIEALLRQADACLYASKDRGRNRVTTST
jgi:two-component system cell cycle response regulator